MKWLTKVALAERKITVAEAFGALKLHGLVITKVEVGTTAPDHMTLGDAVMGSLTIGVDLEVTLSAQNPTSEVLEELHKQHMKGLKP